MRSTVDEHLADKVSEYFFCGIKQLHGRFESYTEIDGNYIEK
jgi:hypothetical protein